LSLSGEAFDISESALRFVQDDQKQKLKNVDQMAAVYCNAYVMVVAAGDEGADNGMRRPGHSLRSSLSQSILPFSPSAKPVVHPLVSSFGIIAKYV
jgi:hypothetical protein